MFDTTELRRAVAIVVEQTKAFEPELLHGADAAALLRVYDDCVRSSTAGRTLAGRRVEATNAHVGSGHRDAASLIASETGVGRSEALGTLATARRLGSLPTTDLALRSGEINLAQATEVAWAAEVSPGAEAELLAVAGRDSADVLKQRSRRFVATGSLQAEAERDERQRRRRLCRIQDEPDGMVSLYALLLPREGAELKALHQGERNRVFRSAQRSGRRDPANQYNADALMAIVARSARPRSGPGGVEDPPRAPKAQCM